MFKNNFLMLFTEFKLILGYLFLDVSLVGFVTPLQFLTPLVIFVEYCILFSIWK